MADRKKMKISLDTGMIVVIFISLMYNILQFQENVACRPRSYNKVGLGTLVAEGNIERRGMELEKEKI